MSCWYACYRLLYYWHHVEKNHEGRSSEEIAKEVKTRIERIPMDFDDLIRNGLDSAHFPTTAGALFLRGIAGARFKDESFDWFVDLLKTRGPVWSAVIYEGYHHVVVAGGYRKSTQMIYVFNPYNFAERPEDVKVELRPFKWLKEQADPCAAALQHW
jgi:hypothetical protein